jgi:hypothetical protein
MFDLILKNHTYEKNEKLRLYLKNDHEDCSGKFDEYVKDPIMNMFLWAVLLNRIEIAKIFWQIGDVKFQFYLSP